MKAEARKSCPNCHRLEARLAALEAVIARLQEELAAARKDSATSSSDIVKPPKPAPPAGQAGRRIGGQPGHPKHERAAFPPEAVNAGAFDYRLDLCPGCGHGLKPLVATAPRVIQQVDIAGPPLSVQEHRGHAGWRPTSITELSSHSPHVQV
jgi:transposase